MRHDNNKEIKKAISALIGFFIFIIIAAHVVYAFEIAVGRVPIDEQPIRHESTIYQTGGF